MSNYLETIYFRDEFSEECYPQKLCDHIKINYFDRHTGSESTDKTLLDFGSGKGNLLVAFARRGLKVSGIDKRPECLEALKDFEIKACDLETEAFPYEDNTFDFVFSKSVIEHVVNFDNIVNEARRVLKPGGMALFMTPDWGSQYKVYWDDYTHVKAWTRKGLQNTMVMNGFENADCLLFRQLPILWKYPWLNIFADITAVLPEWAKWRNRQESDFRTWIRFSKEKMLITHGVKPIE